MRTIIAWVGVAACLSACQHNNSSSTADANLAQATNSEIVQVNKLNETQRLNEWFAVQYEQQLLNSPMMLTFLGRKEKNDQIDNMTQAFAQEQLALAAKNIEYLKANFDYNKLTLEGKTSYDIWVYQFEQVKAGQRFDQNKYVFSQFNGIQAFLAQFLINFHTVDELSDMQAYVKRIGGISTALSQLLAIAKNNAAAGTRVPKFAYQGVIEQSKNLITGKPFSDLENAADTPLWADIKKEITSLVDAKKITTQQANLLKAEAKAQLLEAFLPSYQALITWFESDIVNTVTNPTGVSTQTNGLDFYNYKLETSTTTQLSADEIHKIGLKEVARITQEMVDIKNRVGFKGDLQAFFNFIKTDQQFFYPNTDEGRQGYISDTKTYLADIKTKVPEYFGILPKANLVVKRVEAYREQDGAAQHYMSGSPDGTRDGIYYAHLSDMSAMSKNEMEGVAYHEGIPGHHMQISIAQELTGIPKFRTQASFTVYSEGWGLYSELLAKEMGGYKNDYSDFGRLINEIWRAVRLVVDTGLHAKGWTEEQAIAYFKEKTPVAQEAIVSEIRRYLVIPGQATSYKIGMLKIIELRKNAEKVLGQKFDIRGFHDTILSGGAMPLAILERRVHNWVQAEFAK